MMEEFVRGERAFEIENEGKADRGAINRLAVVYLLRRVFRLVVATAAPLFANPPEPRGVRVSET